MPLGLRRGALLTAFVGLACRQEAVAHADGPRPSVQPAPSASTSAGPGPDARAAAAVRTVLATFPVPGRPKDTFQLAISPCHGKECPLLVALSDGSGAVVEHPLTWAGVSREVSQVDAERGWGAGDPLETTPSLRAWVIGEEETFLATMARPVNLGVGGILIDQLAGFEHLKRAHMLFVDVEGKLSKVWSAEDGPGWTFSSTAIVPVGPDRQAVAVFSTFDHSLDSDTEPDTLTTTVLAWNMETRRVEPYQGPPLLHAVVVGPFDSVRSAKQAREKRRECLARPLILPAKRFLARRQRGFVLVQATSLPAAAKRLASAQAACVPRINSTVVPLL